MELPGLALAVCRDWDHNIFDIGTPDLSDQSVLVRLY